VEVYVVPHFLINTSKSISEIIGAIKNKDIGVLQHYNREDLLAWYFINDRFKHIFGLNTSSMADELFNIEMKKALCVNIIHNDLSEYYCELIDEKNVDSGEMVECFIVGGVLLIKLNYTLGHNLLSSGTSFITTLKKILNYLLDIYGAEHIVKLKIFNMCSI
jgi:hypothetical protein